MTPCREASTQLEQLVLASPMAARVPLLLHQQTTHRKARDSRHLLPGEGGNGGQDPQNAQRAIEAERQRIRSIEDLCTEFGLEARSYIDNGSTEEQVRAAVLEHLRSQHSPVATGIQVTDTQEDKFRRAAADSLLMRSGMTLERPEDGARSLMGMSIRDLAIECLQRDGSSESNLNRRSSDELYTMMSRGFYNPEASFPAILDQTIEKAYKEGYRKVAVTFDKFTKKGSLKDFKKHDNYIRSWHQSASSTRYRRTESSSMTSSKMTSSLRDS